MNYIDKVLEESIYKNEIIKMFYLDPVTSIEISRYTDEQLKRVAVALLDIIDKTSVETIVEIVEADKANIKEITPANIPQFSDINAINGVLDIVKSTNDISFEDIGYYFNKDGTKGSQTKYGENHYKMAALIGLTTKEKPFDVTYLGNKYMELHSEKKLSIRNKLFLRIPIIQTIIIDAKYKKIEPMDILKLYLSESTSIRRRSNVKKMVEYVYKTAGVEFQIELQKNLEWK